MAIPLKEETSMSQKLAGKTALVTGSGRGIGRQIALKLASEGARLVINDLDAAPGDETAAEIRAMGGEAVACNGDVTADGFAERFVQTGIDTFGGLDIIVNNAGYTWDNVIQKMTDEQWHAILNVHLTAPFRIMRAASRFIREAARQEASEGREVFRKVVNISSTSGVYGNAGQANYSTAKAGIMGLTKAMAKEWGRYKEAPAHGGATIDIAGREIAVGVRPEVLKNAETLIPLGRGGQPIEAAGSVYLFCIPESNYVSGQTLVVAGGRP
jgi:3-oxoacyl-[acyl-carrier protein] reductase